ncbi:MAG: AraC family transcriptional regulator [Pseudomonadota bacterium]
MADQSSAEVWQKLSEPFFSVQRLNSARMCTQHISRIWRVGPLVCLQCTCGGQILRRSPGLVEQSPGLIAVSQQLHGRSTGDTEGVPFGVREGDVVVRDLDQTFDLLQYPSTFETILIPREVLGLSSESGFALAVLSEDDPALQKTRLTLNAIFDGLRQADENVSLAQVRDLLLAVRAIVQQPGLVRSPRRSVRQRQLKEIEAFLELHLGRLDLGAETLLPEFGASRATLYRLFERQGGIRSYIVERRLFRALLDISSPPSRRGHIQQAAKRWGFSSAPNFNRSVQHVFGAPPGALFKTTASAEAYVAQTGLSVPLSL